MEATRSLGIIVVLEIVLNAEWRIVCGYNKLQDNIKSVAAFHKDEILIPPRGRKARHPHTRVPRTNAQTQARPHYIHNEYSYPTRQSSLTLYKYILSLSHATWANVSPSRERDGWELGVCLREVANFYFIKWRAWNRSGSMELGHLKNHVLLSYYGYCKVSSYLRRIL